MSRVRRMAAAVRSSTRSATSTTTSGRVGESDERTSRSCWTRSWLETPASDTRVGGADADSGRLGHGTPPGDVSTPGMSTPDRALIHRREGNLTGNRRARDDRPGPGGGRRPRPTGWSAGTPGSAQQVALEAVARRPGAAATPRRSPSRTGRTAGRRTSWAGWTRRSPRCAGRAAPGPAIRPAAARPGDASRSSSPSRAGPPRRCASWTERRRRAARAARRRRLLMQRGLILWRSRPDRRGAGQLPAGAAGAAPRPGPARRGPALQQPQPAATSTAASWPRREADLRRVAELCRAAGPGRAGRGRRGEPGLRRVPARRRARPRWRTSTRPRRPTARTGSGPASCC